MMKFFYLKEKIFYSGLKIISYATIPAE